MPEVVQAFSLRLLRLPLVVQFPVVQRIGVPFRMMVFGSGKAKRGWGKAG